MEAKCNYCDFFGEKPHCHNCKLINNFQKTPSQIEMTLEEFIAKVDAKDLDSFAIGDFMSINLITGEKIRFYIIGKEHDTISGTNEKASLTLQFESLDGYFQMNEEDTNQGGYMASKMNTRMSYFYNLLPDVLKNALKQVDKMCYDRDLGLIKHSCKIFLPSASEISNDSSNYSVKEEGELYEFYENKAAYRSIYRNGNYNWTRSIRKGYSSYFVVVRSDGALFNYGGANYSGGVAPACSI